LRPNEGSIFHKNATDRRARGRILGKNADVDQLLRHRGFMFHRFSGLQGRTYKPLMLNHDPCAAMSQTLWTDAIYVPDLARLDRLESPALIKLAALLHEIYGSFDLTHLVLAAHDRRFATSYAQCYVALLMREQERQT
jgi:hypothetical protein